MNKEQFVEYNAHYKREIMERWFDTFTAINSPEYADSILFQVWERVSQAGPISPYGKALEYVRAFHNDKLVCYPVDCFDALFQAYEARTGEYHPLQWEHYGITKEDYLKHLELRNWLAEGITWPRPDLYQTIHNHFPDLKHIARRGDMDIDGIEFYRFIFKKGEVINIYSGYQDAVNEWHEHNYFSD